jgi:hypothetical protein
MLSDSFVPKPPSLDLAQSQQAYLRDYRQNVTRPRMEAAERALAKHRLDEGQPAAVPLATDAVIEQLKRASDNYSRVVPYIHDLWCEGMFRISSAGGLYSAICLGNRFLKRLDDFSGDELAFEESLATMDLRALVTVLGTALRQDPSPNTGTHSVQRVLAAAAASDSFMSSAMKVIHENWLRACRQHYRDGKHIPYERLNDFYMRKLRANARADILGVLLFVEDGY